MPGSRCPICGARRFQEGACTGCRTVTAMIRLPGGTTLGSYQIKDVLGEGGMGVVYLATHTRLDRRVAIKVLRPEYANDAQARQRFIAEARAVNKITHPNVIEVTDFVEGDDNYYVMELLEGVNLGELTSTGGILALPRSIAIMTQVAEALAAVHRAGIVHRDLKPHNVILIERAGRPDFVKLVDFGIAKLVDIDDPALDPDTAPIFGTPKYMSPEQANGESVDYRSDIHSFGVMLYELVTGRLPYIGADFRELVVKLRTATPIAPRQIEGLPHEVPQSLEALILACLAKDPIGRPNIEAVAARLGAIADEQDGWLLQLGLDRRQQLAEESEPTRIGPGPRPPAIDDEEPLAEPPAPSSIQAPRMPISSESVFVSEQSHVRQPHRARRRLPIAIALLGLVAGVAIAVVIVVGRGSSVGPSEQTEPTAVTSKIDAEIAIADQRMAAGRFVATGGDEALDHLLAARALDPTHRGVRDRLQAIAQRFQHLADEAVASNSLDEAAAHVETVLAADPTNAAAAAQMREIETKILERQRAALPRK